MCRGVRVTSNITVTPNHYRTSNITFLNPSHVRENLGIIVTYQEPYSRSEAIWCTKVLICRKGDEKGVLKI